MRMEVMGWTLMNSELRLGRSWVKERMTSRCSCAYSCLHTSKRPLLQALACKITVFSELSRWPSCLWKLTQTAMVLWIGWAHLIKWSCGVMFVMKLTASGIKVLSQERSESTTKLKHYKLHSIHCKHSVTMVSLCNMVWPRYHSVITV